MERHHQSHGLNQTALCVQVLTEEVQSSPAIGPSPSGPSVHDQPASKDHTCPAGQSGNGGCPDWCSQLLPSEACLVVRLAERQYQRQDRRIGALSSHSTSQDQPAILHDLDGGKPSRLGRRSGGAQRTGAGQTGRAGRRVQRSACARRCASVTPSRAGKVLQ